MGQHPDFVYELTTKQCELGLRLAQAVLRARANETLAYQMGGENPVYARMLPACQKRSGQARDAFTEFCKQIGKLCKLPHHVIVADYFRSVAGHIEPNLEDWAALPATQADKRANRYKAEHDARVRASDIRFLMMRDGLTYIEATRKYDGEPS